MIEKLPETQKWKLKCRTRKGWFDKTLTQWELTEWITTITTYGGVFKDLPDGSQELVEIPEFEVKCLNS